MSELYELGSVVRMNMQARGRLTSHDSLRCTKSTSLQQYTASYCSTSSRRHVARPICLAGSKLCSYLLHFSAVLLFWTWPFNYCIFTDARKANDDDDDDDDSYLVLQQPVYYANTAWHNIYVRNKSGRVRPCRRFSRPIKASVNRPSDARVGLSLRWHDVIYAVTWRINDVMLLPLRMHDEVTFLFCHY